MDELLPILKELKPDVDFESETGLIDNAILDSFDIVQLVQQLNDAFDIEIVINSDKSIVVLILLFFLCVPIVLISFL